MIQPKTLIVGIGSAHGDDQIGWMIADRLTSALNSESVDVRHAKTPVDVIDWLDNIQHLVLCDACTGLGNPGTFRNFAWPTSEILTAHFSSTHGMSVPSVLRLAESLGKLPQRVDIWAIQKSECTPTETISPDLLSQLTGIVRQIIEGLQQPTHSYS